MGRRASSAGMSRHTRIFSSRLSFLESHVLRPPDVGKRLWMQRCWIRALVTPALGSAETPDHGAVHLGPAVKPA